jgi:hypothetical protein
MPGLGARSRESSQSGEPNLASFSGARIDPGSLLPLVFSAQPCNGYDSGFLATRGTAYPFPKQNEGNPKEKHCTHQTCKYEKHAKKFLDNVETHCKPHSGGLLMTG